MRFRSRQDGRLRDTDTASQRYRNRYVLSARIRGGDKESSKGRRLFNGCFFMRIVQRILFLVPSGYRCTIDVSPGCISSIPLTLLLHFLLSYPMCHAVLRFQIIGRLLTVWKHVKRGTLAKVQDGSAIAKIDCPFRRGRIQRLLSMAVCFDRRQRPSAAVMMNHFLALRKRMIRKTAQKQG